MTIREIIDDLEELAREHGEDKFCVVVDTDIEPDPDVLNVYYDEERDRICFTLL